MARPVSFTTGKKRSKAIEVRGGNGVHGGEGGGVLPTVSSP